MNTLQSADAMGVVFTLVWPLVLAAGFSTYLRVRGEPC